MADLRATPGKEPTIFIKNGEVRIISRDGAEDMIASVIYRGALSAKDLRHHCGALLHGRFIDRPIKDFEIADVLNISSIPVGVVPNVPIIKMMKSEHANLLKKGFYQIRLDRILPTPRES